MSGEARTLGGVRTVDMIHSPAVRATAAFAGTVYALGWRTSGAAAQIVARNHMIHIKVSGILVGLIQRPEEKLKT
jgi:hypothetical protein